MRRDRLPGVRLDQIPQDAGHASATVSPRGVVCSFSKPSSTVSVCHGVSTRFSLDRALVDINWDPFEAD